jgi:hypothetical protein
MYTTIKTLWNKGHNKSEIARLTRHDWKTIDKVIKATLTGKKAPTKKPHARLLESHTKAGSGLRNCTFIEKIQLCKPDPVFL